MREYGEEGERQGNYRKRSLMYRGVMDVPIRGWRVIYGSVVSPVPYMHTIHALSFPVA